MFPSMELVNYSTLDDATLLRLIAVSHDEALSALYDRYSRLVFSLAYHMVGDSQTAEEITQDVFVRVWEKADTYRQEQSKVSTWLTSITRYRSIDVLRRRGVRPELNSVSWAEVPPHAQPVGDNDPEETAEQELESLRIRRAIAALPPEQQQALGMAFFYGLTHRQIAELLGDPLGTVKTRIRLGMKKLRELLGE